MQLLGLLLLMSPFISVMAYNDGLQNSRTLFYTHKNGTIEDISVFKKDLFYDLSMYNISTFLLALAVANMLIMLFISRMLYGDKNNTLDDYDSSDDDEYEYEDDNYEDDNEASGSRSSSERKESNSSDEQEIDMENDMR